MKTILYSYRQYFSLFKNSNFNNPFAGLFLLQNDLEKIDYFKLIDHIQKNVEQNFSGDIIWMEHEVSDYFMEFLKNYFNEISVDKFTLYLYMETPNGLAFFSYNNDNLILQNLITIFKTKYEELIINKSFNLYEKINYNNINQIIKFKEENIIL